MTLNNQTHPPMGGAIKSQRSSNLELYRIIVMFLIICHHYVVCSGLIADNRIMDSEYAYSSIFYLLFGAWGKTGINCFILITGYFMCKSSITLRKFLKLLLQVYFYKIVFTTIFLITGYEEHWKSAVYTAVLPLEFFSSNFICGFIGLYLFIPFVNKLLNNINRQQHLLLVTFLLGLYTILPLIPGVSVAMNYVSWFVVVYLIGALIRLYPTVLPKHESVRYWSCATFLCLFLSSISIVAIWYFNVKTGSTHSVYRMVVDTNALMAVVVSVCSFMMFKNLKLKQSRLINTISATTFGVLLIHSNSNTMRRWLWCDVVDCTGNFGTEYFWLYATISVILVFAVCSFLDWIRIVTIEMPLINYTELVINKIICKIKKK